MDTAEVHRIAHLARLAIAVDDAPGYAHDLSAILDLVAQLNEIDTHGVEPLAHPLDMHQRLRADKVTESDQRERLQAGAPLTESGLYLVPRVIE